MPISLQVSENGALVKYIFNDTWAVDELQALFDQDRRHRDKMNFPVVTFLDVTGLHYLPPNALKVRHSPAITHRYGGIVIVIGANPLIRRVIETMFEIAQKEAVFVDTETEAWTYLERSNSDRLN